MPVDLLRVIQSQVWPRGQVSELSLEGAGFGPEGTAGCAHFWQLLKEAVRSGVTHMGL